MDKKRGAKIHSARESRATRLTAIYRKGKTGRTGAGTTVMRTPKSAKDRGLLVLKSGEAWYMMPESLKLLEKDFA